MKKLLSIILTILMIVSSVPFVFAMGDYTYDAENDTYTVYTYAGLETALNAGGTIVLGADITKENARIETIVPENVTAILDLNGKTITLGAAVSSEIISVYGNLLVKDSGTEGAMDSSANKIALTILCAGGNLTIESGNFISSPDMGFALCAHSGNVIVNGGTFNGSESLNVNEGNVTINGGTFLDDVMNVNGTLTINGGTFLSKVFKLKGTVNIFNGNFSVLDETYVVETSDIITSVDGTYTVVCNHTGTATCIAEAVCEICGVEYGDIDANNHKDTLVQVGAKSNTCTDIGWDAYEYCTVCDYTTYKENSALGHVDNDGDYKCDNGCGHEFEKPAEPEEPSDDVCKRCGRPAHDDSFIQNLVCIIIMLIKLITTMF